MAEFGISETGFELKRLDDILAEKRQLAVALFQDLVIPGDFVDTSDSSTLGRLINLSSVSETELWEIGQAVYSAFDPNASYGIALDNLVQLGGIQRLGASYSLVTGLFSGDNGVTIPIDSVVGSSTSTNSYNLTSPVILSPTSASGVVVQIDTVTNGTIYTINYSIASTVGTVTYTADISTSVAEILVGLLANITSAHPILDGFIENNTLRIMSEDVFSKGSFTTDAKMSITKVYNLGNLQASVVGSIFDAANSVTTIKTPVLGWDTVTNPLAVSEGRVVETDEELRIRFRNTKYERSSNILDSLYSALLSLDTVESVTIYENDTDITDSNNLPPHSFMAVVLGGDSEEIAETIWRNKPAGISSIGNTSVEIIDSQNYPRDINFQRPTAVPIYITMTLSTTPEYPANGAELIRNAIVQFAKEEFGVGEDIIYSRLYTPINTVQGHEVESLFVGTYPSPTGEDSIDIDFDKIGTFNPINIIVNTI